MVERKFCDRCNRDITKKPQREVYLSGREKPSDDFMNYDEKDLCAQCYREFEKRFNSFMAEKGAQ